MPTSAEAVVQLPDDVDLHARPAAQFVRTALRHARAAGAGSGIAGTVVGDQIPVGPGERSSSRVRAADIRTRRSAS